MYPLGFSNITHNLIYLNITRQLELIFLLFLIFTWMIESQYLITNFSQEPFPTGINIRPRLGRSRNQLNHNNEDHHHHYYHHHQDSPLNSSTEENSTWLVPSFSGLGLYVFKWPSGYASVCFCILRGVIWEIDVVQERNSIKKILLPFFFCFSFYFLSVIIYFFCQFVFAFLHFWCYDLCCLQHQEFCMFILWLLF